MVLQQNGLYIVADSYFHAFPSAHWMWNKGESRPHYYAIQDKNNLYWMIPLSSQAGSYKEKIQKIEKSRGVGNCLYYHIGKVSGRETAFIISGLFPVTPEYIVRSYTVNQQPYVIQNKKLNRELHGKVMRYLCLLEQGRMKDINHILKIKETLILK